MDKIIYSGTHGECSWEINENENLRIFPTNGNRGLLADMRKEELFSPWEFYASEIKSVTIEKGVCLGEDASCLFYGLDKCESYDLANLDTSKTTNISQMFAGNVSLKQLDLSTFNVENVWSAYSMMRDCMSMEKINFGKWNALQMSDASGMLDGCKSLKAVDMREVEFGAKLSEARALFRDCENLEAVKLNPESFKNATIGNIFEGCSKLAARKNLEQEMTGAVWERGEHGECSWEISKEGKLRIFPTNGISGTLDNQDNYDFQAPWEEYANDIKSVVVEQGVSTGGNADYLFYGLKNCKEMNLANLDTSKAHSLVGMFEGCSSLRNLDVSNFSVRNAEYLDRMFSNDTSLTTLKIFDPHQIKPHVYGRDTMFSGCAQLKNLRDLEKEAFAKEPKAWEPPKPKEVSKDKNLEDMMH